MDLSNGICPHCESAGNPGEACGRELCRRKGYHFIPQSSFEKIAATPYEERDPLFGRMVDDYLVAGQLGEGGFGKVYLALQMPLFMMCALKLMVRRNTERQMFETMTRRFRDEAMSLAKLRHPNIVKLLKYGAFLDRPYLVMEYVDNARTLEDYIFEFDRGTRGFELSTLRQIVEQVFNALESAHAQKIVHRDLKPENIMLQQVTGNAYFSRILDFGLAKIIEGSMATTMMAGTPVYMAPEQLGGRGIGPWTDVYALGVILFELLIGVTPFPGDTVEAVIGQKIDPTFGPFSRPPGCELPPFFLGFCKRAMAVAVEERYNQVTEFREATFAVFDELTRIGVTHSGRALANALLGEERAQGLYADAVGLFESRSMTPVPVVSQGAGGGVSASSARHFAAEDTPGFFTGETVLTDPAHERDPNIAIRETFVTPQAHRDGVGSIWDTPWGTSSSGLPTRADWWRSQWAWSGVFGLIAMIVLFAWPAPSARSNDRTPLKSVARDPSEVLRRNSILGKTTLGDRPLAPTRSSLKEGELPVFSRLFGGEGRDRAVFVARAADGTLVLVGHSESTPGAGRDVWLARLGRNGELLREKRFPTPQNEEVVAAALEPGGGLYIVGTLSDSKLRNQIFLMRVDRRGRQVWRKEFGGSFDDDAAAVFIAANGGCYVVGSTRSKGNGQSDAWLMRISVDGGVVWERTYGTRDDEAINGATVTRDGRLILVGRVRSPKTGTDDFWVVAVDGGGDKLWSKKFGAEGISEEAFAVVEDPLGDLWIVGTRRVVAGGQLSDGWVVRLNRRGELHKSDVYGQSGADRFLAVTYLQKAKQIAIVGDTPGKSRGAGQGWLLLLAPNGSKVSEHRFGKWGQSSFLYVVEDSDGGILIAGERLVRKRSLDAWLVKKEVNAQR
ncbi:MAG: serine/threonine-protein kinase [Myxococcales bacterium]|nr:serine/threonine-protein kinase [Myxococcales bacterium]